MSRFYGSLCIFALRLENFCLILRVFVQLILIVGRLQSQSASMKLAITVTYITSTNGVVALTAKAMHCMLFSTISSNSLSSFQAVQTVVTTMCLFTGICYRDYVYSHRFIDVLVVVYNRIGLYQTFVVYCFRLLFFSISDGPNL